MLDYDRTWFDGGGADGGDRDTERRPLHCASSSTTRSRPKIDQKTVCSPPSAPCCSQRAAPAARADKTLLNVSYDPTRELYEEYNALFAKHWQETKGETVTIQQSHGGSGKQARAVIDGLEADVVTLALAGDVERALRARQPDPEGVAEAAAEQQLPLHLDDRVPGAQGQPEEASRTGTTSRSRASAVITPNPKTSGGARWNFLAAWGYALDKYGGDEAKARGAASAASTRTPPCSTPARAARRTTFVERGIGDVLIAWENEALLALETLGQGEFEIVVPSDEHPRRAAGRGRRHRGAAQGHGRGRGGVPPVPLLARSAGR